MEGTLADEVAGQQANDGDNTPANETAPEPTTQERIDALKAGNPDPAIKAEAKPPETEGEKPSEGDEKPNPDEINTPKEGETIAQMIERRAAEMAEETAAVTEAERIANEQAAAVADFDKKLNDAFAAGATSVATNLMDAEGKPMFEPADLQAKVFDPLNKVFDQVKETYAAQAFDEVVAAGHDLVPEDGREAFMAATVDKGLSASDWLAQLAEAAAPNTAAWKAREKAYATEKVAATEEGFALGRKPGASGMASQRNGSNPTTVVTDGKNADEISRMGLTTKDIEREIARIKAAT